MCDRGNLRDWRDIIKMQKGKVRVERHTAKCDRGNLRDWRVIIKIQKGKVRVERHTAM
jgi:hypothetical protein